MMNKAYEFTLHVRVAKYDDTFEQGKTDAILSAIERIMTGRNNFCYKAEIQHRLVKVMMRTTDARDIHHITSTLEFVYAYLHASLFTENYRIELKEV